MKVKNSGFTASGPVRPEIHTSDIFFDKYGWMVKVISVEERRITCRCEGYNYDCVTPVPESYGEQVHRVGERFAILEAALVLSGHVTGWNVQTCCDAIQHNFNAWVKEFGTGNKEHRQIIEQAEAFLTAYGMSRFAPVNYDPASLPISELYGYRESEGRYGEPVLFYVLPEPFKSHVAKGFNKDAVARALHEAGMLKKPASGEGWQIRTPRLKHMKGARLRVYGLLLAQDHDDEGG